MHLVPTFSVFCVKSQNRLAFDWFVQKISVNVRLFTLPIVLIGLDKDYLLYLKRSLDQIRLMEFLLSFFIVERAMYVIC